MNMFLRLNRHADSLRTTSVKASGCFVMYLIIFLFYAKQFFIKENASLKESVKRGGVIPMGGLAGALKSTCYVKNLRLMKRK
ncbi:hypothetical protein [Neisseria animaloris]|uniref:hypothetical protein n=1 Tax=Neisseria animaloris TaxID=326522 RepID=UPI001B803C44|nr:hypothetical protein [Neisseria animaloris]